MTGMNRHFWHVSHFREERRDKHRAEAAATKAARRQQRENDELEERLDKLTLICHAMWELLRDRAKMSEADLMEKVQQLDLRDGVPDGKVTARVSQCPKCDRTMSPRHKKCLYCGFEELVNSAFDGL